MPERPGDGAAGPLRRLLDQALAARRIAGAAAAPEGLAPESEDCPECGGRGWVVVADGGAGTARRCRCSVQDALPRLEREAGIPSRYQGCRLESFRTTQPQLLQAREVTRRWVDEFLSPEGRFRESGLLFIGPPGVGKTHLASAALGEVIRRYRVRGRFVDFTTLIYQIQSTFDAASPETKQSVLDPVVSAEVLVLDELGAQKPSPWVSEILYLVLNGRYTARLPTLFTTNYYLEPAASGTTPLDRGASGDLLSHRIPAMLVSRLWEMALPVVMAGDDFRRVVKSHQHR